MSASLSAAEARPFAHATALHVDAADSDAAGSDAVDSDAGVDADDMTAEDADADAVVDAADAADAVAETAPAEHKPVQAEAARKAPAPTPAAAPPPATLPLGFVPVAIAPAPPRAPPTPPPHAARKPVPSSAPHPKAEPPSPPQPSSKSNNPDRYNNPERRNNAEWFKLSPDQKIWLFRQCVEHEPDYLATWGKLRFWRARAEELRETCGEVRRPESVRQLVQREAKARKAELQRCRVLEREPTRSELSALVDKWLEISDKAPGKKRPRGDGPPKTEPRSAGPQPRAGRTTSPSESQRSAASEPPAKRQRLDAVAPGPAAARPGVSSDEYSSADEPDTSAFNSEVAHAFRRLAEGADERFSVFMSNVRQMTSQMTPQQAAYDEKERSRLADELETLRSEVRGLRDTVQEQAAALTSLTVLYQRMDGNRAAAD